MPDNDRVTRRLALVVALLVLAGGGITAGWLAYRNSTAERIPAIYRPMVIAAAATCPGLPPAILGAQIAQESGWRPKAVSSAGAEGIAQFIPSTWRAFGVDANHDGTIDVFDPADAIFSAAKYDCQLLHETSGVSGSHLSNMLAAYNAGPSAVRRHDGIPPYPETQKYVTAILARAGRAAYPALG